MGYIMDKPLNNSRKKARGIIVTIPRANDNELHISFLTLKTEKSQAAPNRAFCPVIGSGESVF